MDIEEEILKMFPNMRFPPVDDSELEIKSSSFQLDDNLKDMKFSAYVNKIQQPEIGKLMYNDNSGDDDQSITEMIRSSGIDGDYDYSFVGDSYHLNSCNSSIEKNIEYNNSKSSISILLDDSFFEFRTKSGKIYNHLSSSDDFQKASLSIEGSKLNEINPPVIHLEGSSKDEKENSELIVGYETTFNPRQLYFMKKK